MPIANVALTNTFDEQRGTINQLIVAINDMNGEGTTYRNITANGVAANSATVAGVNVSSTLAASFVQANAGYLIANAGIIQANTARDHANAAHLTANASYGMANTANTTSVASFAVANTANTTSVASFAAANTAQATGVASFAAANTAQATGVASFAAANTAQATGVASFAKANTANTTSVASFAAANTAQATGVASFAVANSGFAIANAAIARANTGIMDAVSGLIVSRTGNDTWALSAGDVRDTTNTYTIALSAALTAKTLSGAWAAGSSTGGRTGAAEASSTAYHVFGIYNPSTFVSDALVGSSYTSPTLPSGFTHYRYLGTLYNDGSSHLTPQSHSGDYIHFDAPLLVVQDNTLVATVYETATLPVPPHAICMLQFPVSDSGAKADWRSGLKKGGASLPTAANGWSNTQQIPNITDGGSIEAGGKGLVQVSSTSTIQYGVQTEATVASIEIYIHGYFIPTRRNPAL